MDEQGTEVLSPDRTGTATTLLEELPRWARDLAQKYPPILTDVEVGEIFRLNARTIERKAKRGQLPKPFSLGDRCKRWSRDECVLALVAARG